MREKKQTILSVSEASRIYGGCALGDRLMLIDDLSHMPLQKVARRTKCIIVGLCQSGTATYTVGTNRCVVKSGDAIIINEEQFMGDYHTSADLKGMGFLMSREFLGDVLRHVHEKALIFFQHANPVFPLSGSGAERFGHYFRLMQLLIHQDKHIHRENTVESVMAALFYDLSNVFHQLQQAHLIPQTRQEGIFEQFIRLVEQHYKQERRVAWYSQQMCLSAKYLAESVKEASGRTPTEWITTYITLEMRHLLKNTSMDIKEIAAELNFSTQSFFGKFFKKHVGMSPSDYRNT